MFELWKLNRERKRLAKFYAKQREAIEKGKPGQHDREMLLADEGFEFQTLADQEAAEVTRRLLRKAHRHYLPVPESRKEPYWYQGYQTESYYLTEAGVKKVREELREFWKYRTEMVVQLGTLLIGLIGVVIGLVAVIEK